MRTAQNGPQNSECLPGERAQPGSGVALHGHDKHFRDAARMPLAHDGTGPGGDTQASARDGGLARAALRRYDAGIALPTARWFWCDLRDSTLDELDGRVILRW